MITIRGLFREVKIKLKVKWIFFTIAVFFLAIYLTFSIWIASSVRNIIETAYKANGVYSSELSKYVDPDLFSLLNCRNGYPSYPDKKIVENYKLSWGFALHNFSKGVVRVKYSYEGIDKATGKVLYGSWDIPVRITVKLRDEIWHLERKHEDA